MWILARTGGMALFQSVEEELGDDVEGVLGQHAVIHGPTGASAPASALFLEYAALANALEAPIVFQGSQ